MGKSGVDKGIGGEREDEGVGGVVEGKAGALLKIQVRCCTCLFCVSIVGAPRSVVS